MGGVYEGLELVRTAEMPVRPREIGDPVTVIARAFLTLRPLHRLVLEDRREPDRGDAEALQIIQPLGQALQVAAVEEALGGGIEARRQPIALQAAAIVRAVAIFEPVGQNEIDDLVLRRPFAHGLQHGAGRLLRRGRHRQRQRGEEGEGVFHDGVPCPARIMRARKSIWWSMGRTCSTSAASVSPSSARKSFSGSASATGL